MQIDPVVLLADEIRNLEAELRAECKMNSGSYDRERTETINLLVGRVRALYETLLETAPSSALGAGELIRIAASRLPFAHARYTTHLYRIADRLAAGQRLQTDLIWLRALSEALAGGAGDESGRKAIVLLLLAVKGMAQPVLVYRAVAATSAWKPNLRELSEGPFVPVPPRAYVPQPFLTE